MGWEGLGEQGRAWWSGEGFGALSRGGLGGQGESLPAPEPL